MIVEERIYTLKVGDVPKYLKLYLEEGYAIQKRILGQLVGYYQVEIGPQNQVVHLWAYDSFEDRGNRRAALTQDEGWKTYVKKIRPLIRYQENKILKPISISPIPTMEDSP